EKPKSPEPPSPQATPQSTSTGTPPPGSAPSSPASSAPPPPTASTPTTTDPFENDPNRPLLSRGKQAPRAFDQDSSTPPAKTPPPALTGAVQLISAISDAAGPDPRPYAYSLKPEEEEKFRTRMLALAGDEVRARSRQLAAETVGATGSARSSSRPGKAVAAKGTQLTFENVQLRVFDLSNSNEP